MNKQEDKSVWEEGLQIDHHGRSLHVEKRLSAGLTGEVYKGTLVDEQNQRVPVAIKVMKSLDFPMARRLFEEESETLAFMTHLEAQANQKQHLDLKVAPQFYGRNEYEGRPYIVMEFIAGTEIPKLLQLESPNPTRLEEPQALIITWHLYRTLDIMHTQLRKSYIDLKFENLWWVIRPDNSGQLKMTDFGTLEAIRRDDEQKRGPKRDVLLASVYLCAMLTGYVLNYSLGELKEPAEPLLHRHQNQMSWGTYRLLRRLLHRNPQARPQTAEEVAHELRTLVRFWQVDMDRLLAAAENNLAKAEGNPTGKEAANDAARARSALDVARIRQPEDAGIAMMIDRANRILKLSDYEQRGRALFDGRSYGLARKVFEEGMHWSDDVANLRRWACLARIGEAVTPATFDEKKDDVLAAKRRMDDAQWLETGERLMRLSDLLNSEGLTNLIKEAELFAALDKGMQAAGNSKYREAEANYRQAEEILKQLLYRDSVKDEVGDLLSRTEELGRLAQTYQAARERISQALALLQGGTA